MNLPRIEVGRVGPATVLHIEEDRDVANAVARLLRLDGYHVICAASRDEAIRLVEDGLIPDLILTDYHLPRGISGDRIVAEIVYRLGFKPPTLMLATLSDHETRTLSSVVDRIFAKSSEIDLVLHEIGCLLGPRA